MSSTTSRWPWVERARPRARPLVIAHRGGAALAPENTFAAFEQAVALGVDACELDVRLSHDGEVVVIHDATLDRTTDTTGLVSARSAAELSHVDAGFAFAHAGERPYRARGLGVPLLADVLARFPDMLLVIELKGNDVELARVAARVVRDAGAIDRVCVGGFAGPALLAARAAEPRLCTGAARDEIRAALYRSYIRWPLGNRGYQVFQVPERSGSTRVVSPRFVRAAHRADRLVQVWTVNDAVAMRRLVDWGVDGLITDRPDLALEVVGARPPAPVPARPDAAPAAAPGR